MTILRKFFPSSLLPNFIRRISNIRDWPSRNSYLTSFLLSTFWRIYNTRKEAWPYIESSLPVSYFLLSGEYLISEWRPDLIEKVLSQLNPNNLREVATSIAYSFEWTCPHDLLFYQLIFFFSMFDPPKFNMTNMFYASVIIRTVDNITVHKIYPMKYK